MVEQEQAIISELSGMAVSAIKPVDIADFITNKITRLFAAKYHMVWLVKDGLIYPYLYSRDEDLITNLYTQKLIKTSFNLNDGVWDKLLKDNEPAVIDLAELMQLKIVPEWVPLWYNQGLRQMLGVPVTDGGHLKGFFCLYGNRLNKPEKTGSDFLKIVARQVFTCIRLLQLEQVISEQREEITRIRHTGPLQNEIADTGKQLAIVGSGAAMKNVIRLVSLVAPSETAVLLTGETGTGKEVVARAIHEGSTRREQPMIRVNCAALPANLIESELFGHEKGSFTGASERRIGKFELADGGTIFLDEIGELPLELQVRLLRVLQEKEVERIGGKSSFKVNVRVIAATNRDLLKAVANGQFRSDLYFRLNVFPIQLPPLHQRKEDIPGLVDHFIERYALKKGIKIKGVSAGVIRNLQSYSWPGNIRELENLVERSLLNSQGDRLTEVELPANIIAEETTKASRLEIRTLAEMERDYILKVVKHCGGKISGKNGAAVKLGIPSTTLISKMKKLGIQKAHFADR